MEVRNVDSSVLSAVGYDAETEVLEVHFSTGRVHRYHNVPAEIYDRLLAASSIGRYFNEHVRERFWSELVYDRVRV